MSGPDFPFHTIVVSLIGSKEWWDAPLTPSGCSSHINEPLRANVSLNGLLNYWQLQGESQLTSPGMEDKQREHFLVRISKTSE